MPFYNTPPPTPSSKNTITSITVDYGIRDFLLNKNLLPSYPFLSTSLNGSPRIGEPVLDTMVGTGNVTQPFGLPLETEGILRMEIAVLPNKFKNSSSTANNLTTIEDIQQSVGVFPNSTWQNGITNYPTGSNPDVFQYGIMGKTVDGGFRKNATIKNLYLDVDKQVDSADWITLETAPITQQIKGYLDVYGGLNLGGSEAIQASSIIGSVLNGQGLGLAKGGVVTNFDLRSSLAGRVLGATGVINDTKLGMIGGQQLALALANNAAFNVEQSVLGSLNVQDNILSLVKNGTLAGFRPNYQITVPSGNGGKVLDYTAKILGFTLPKSYLNDAGSIFLSESNTANIERANSMILNTGRGQVQAMITNIFANINGTTQYDSPDTAPFRSGYAPGYKDNKGKDAINPSLYAFYNSDRATIYNFLINKKGVIPEINYNRSGMISEYGFTGPEENVDVVNPYAVTSTNSPTLKGNQFIWGSSVGGTVNSENSPFGGNIVDPFLAADKKKSLLAKTQLLFNDLGMKNIVSGFGDINSTIKASQIQTSVVGGGISKGSAVMTGTRFNDSGHYTGELDLPVNTYCRTWTTKLRYDSVTNLIRSSGLNATVPYRQQMNNSTLDEYGFVKIAPYSTDSMKIGDPKNYMFSIENLAWADNWADLLPCEVGPGDMLSGKRGRIMWFPPYNIQFSENSSVSWETNNFIGRGESIYTYNNTERSGNLSFSIIVDHPSYINSFRGADGPDDSYVTSFFAGCIDPSSKFADKLTVSEMSSIATKETTIPQKKVVEKQTPPPDMEVYFPNDVAVLPSTYENGLSGNTTANTINYGTYTSGFGLGVYPGSFTSSGPWDDNHNFGLNGQKNIITVDGQQFNGFLDPLLISMVNEYLNTKCPACVVEVSGYASPQGKPDVNQKLADARADYIIKSIKPQWHTNFNGAEKDKRFKKMPSKALTGTGCIAIPGADTDTFACKKDRKAVIHFRFDENLLPKELTNPEPVIKKEQQRVNSKITNRLYTECSYFEQLTDKDSFVFDKFREKIRYFHPAFHSTTPEGLNSRLTFLQQCTRQGPTLENQGANNLAFGRPPVCILRIGDFYNTKVIIDNISIDYDPLVWDLNPEGIGVQPMIAHVSMSFKFIGGSTLMGPINKLQNALSFNYYANSQVYDPRADYIAKTDQSKNKAKTSNENGVSTVTALRPYYLVNGVKDVNSLVEKVDTPAEIINNTPEIDQTAAEANSSGPEAPQPSSETPQGDDLDRINLYRIDSIINGVELFFDVSNSGQLNNDQSFRVILTDNDKITRELGIGTILKTGGASSFKYTGGISGLVEDKTYFVIAKFGNVNKTNTFKNSI